MANERSTKAAEAVVQTNQADIGILMDVNGIHEKLCDGYVAAAQEEVVVLEAHRPVRRKAKFKSGADGAAPASFAYIFIRFR